MFRRIFTIVGVTSLLSGVAAWADARPSMQHMSKTMCDIGARQEELQSEPVLEVGDITEAKRQLILELYRIGAIKWGEFTLRSGELSPVYLDLRSVISYPSLLRSIAASLIDLSLPCRYQLVCGVPYTALPIATAMSLDSGIPLVMCRKEAKAYGTKKRVEGAFDPQDVCLLVEDVVTSGQSVLETAALLQQEGLDVQDIVVFFDRQRGAREAIEQKGYRLHAYCSLSDVVDVLEDEGLIEAHHAARIQSYIRAAP